MNRPRSFSIYYDQKTKVATFVEGNSTEYGDRIGGLTVVIDPAFPIHPAFIVDTLLRRREIDTTSVTINDEALKVNT